MKKICLLSVCIFIFFVSVAEVYADWNSEYSPLYPSFQVLVSVATGYVNNTSMNDLTKRRARKDADKLNHPFKRNQVESSPAHHFPLGLDFELRFFYDTFGLGLQAGYHAVRAKTDVVNSVTDSVETTTTSYLSVKPVVATLYYRIELGSIYQFLLVGAGTGYYFGRIDLEHEGSILASSEYFGGSYKAQTQKGYHFLIEYDIYSSSSLTFFAGLKARYLKFDEFKKGGNALKVYGTDKNVKASLTGIACYAGLGLSF